MIALGTDHGGLELKELLKTRLTEAGWQVKDFGCHTKDMIDYPEKAVEVAQAVLQDKLECGILICGSGIGMSIAANKVKGIRAAHCSDTYSARMAKEHNDANIITIGGRTIGPELAWEMVKAYLGAQFQKGIHQKRVDFINAMDAD